ncbi:hypothetical protein C8J57DRAFT_1198289 [Mycena rebaudengoi]|nr:hypothetical protein C8J57DRAFT_1198289 [Mycena rebaudengoi]
MSTTGEGSKITRRKRAPKPRTEPLRRGTACLNCRHLKIRCDGARPVCGPCTRVPKADPCEFSDVKSRTKELEKTIQLLKSRVKELEQVSSNPSNTVPSPTSTHLMVDFSAATAPSSPDSSILSGGSTSDSDHSFLGVHEPPSSMMHMLLDHFLPHASQFGFFMHVDNFRASALLPLPFGHADRPSPALLCTVYLWGVHLANSQPLASYERVFIRRAQQHISTELADSTHAAHRIHTIQAHILLSTYFLRSKHFLEAEFHANGAVTLALSYGLNKIRSARPAAALSLLGGSGLSDIFVPPPRGSVEEGEHISAFWAVFCLQSNLILTLRPSSNLGMLESSNLEIDTPWPNSGILPPDLLGHDTVEDFLVNGAPGATSFFALQAQASVLLQRATELAKKWSPSMEPQDFTTYMNANAWLDARIQVFQASLPPLSDNYTHPDDARTLALTHALVAAALIQLQNTGVGAPETCVRGARLILDALGDTQVPQFVCAGTVVGTLLVMACLVLINEVEKARFLRTALGSDTDVMDGEEMGLVLDLQNGLTTLMMYAIDCPLACECHSHMCWLFDLKELNSLFNLAYQQEKVQQKCIPIVL